MEHPPRPLATSLALRTALPQSEQRNKTLTLTDLANVGMTLPGFAFAFPPSYAYLVLSTIPRV